MKSKSEALHNAREYKVLLFFCNENSIKPYKKAPLFYLDTVYPLNRNWLALVTRASLFSSIETTPYDKIIF